MKTLVAVALVAATSANAYTGNEFLNDANAQSHYDRGFSLGFLRGVADSLSTQQIVCFPKNTTVGQTFDVVKKKLVDNPDIRHIQADILIQASLLATFPCKGV